MSAYDHLRENLSMTKGGEPGSKELKSLLSKLVSMKREGPKLASEVRKISSEAYKVYWTLRSNFPEIEPSLQNPAYHVKESSLGLSQDLSNLAKSLEEIQERIDWLEDKAKQAR